MANFKQRCSDWFEENGPKIMLFFMVLQSIALVAYTIFMFMSLDPDDDQIHFRIYKWLCLVVLGVYLFYLYFHAVVKENSVELVAFLIVSAIVNGNSVYRIFTYSPNADHEIAFYLDSRVIVIGLSIVSQVVYFVLAFAIHRKFGWRRYNLFGTNPRVIGMYKLFQLFQTLVKSSMILSALICTMVFFTFYWTNMIVFCVNIFLVLSMVTNHLMGIFSARYEEATLFKSFRIIQVLTEIYKIVMMFLVTEFLMDDPNRNGGYDTINSVIALTLSFMFVSTPLTLSILFLGHKVASNFNQGIKDILDKENGEESQGGYARLR